MALTPERRESLRLSLLGELAELEKAFDLLETSHDPDLAGVLSNILYLGMPKEAERVLSLGGDCACSVAETTENTTER